MGFPRQEYWSGLPFSFPGNLPDPGIKPGSPSLQADALTSELPEKLKVKISWSIVELYWKYEISIYKMVTLHCRLMDES